MRKKYKKHQREAIFKDKEPYATFDRLEKEIQEGRKKFITQRVKEEGKTYAEVGKETKLTWQRIGQIVVEMTKKLRKKKQK
jgi:DNA-directed RNA polymerase sigma subunit (sigma70/sigma32)